MTIFNITYTTSVIDVVDNETVIIDQIIRGTNKVQVVRLDTPTKVFSETPYQGDLTPLVGERIVIYPLVVINGRLLAHIYTKDPRIIDSRVEEHVSFILAPRVEND